MFLKPKSGHWIFIQDGLVIASNLDIDVKILTDKTNKKINFEFCKDIYLKIFLQYTNDINIDTIIAIKILQNIDVGLSLNFLDAKNSIVNLDLYVTLLEYCNLSITSIQKLDDKAELNLKSSFEIKENATCKNFLFLKNAKFLSNIIKVKLNFKSEFKLAGLMLGDKEQKQNIDVDIVHIKDFAKSYVHVKDVVKDSSECSFKALSTVKKDTKNSVVSQENHALILSPDAKAHSEPHLQIYSDDLKASHACTIGELDELSISYLMSRGISKDMSKKMLIRAFIENVLDNLDDRCRDDVIRLLEDNYV